MKSLIFFGTPTFSATILKALLTRADIRVALVVTQPDRPARRGKKLQPSPTKELALAHNLAILQPSSLRKELPSFLEAAAPYGPFDLGIVVAFGQILPRAVLDLPRRGCLNLHASLLPRWRGAAPIQRAIMAGDTSTGICLMAMDEGLDTGPVYQRAEIALSPTENAGSVHDRLANTGAALLLTHLDSILNGTCATTSQPTSGITYAAKITSIDEQLNFAKSTSELRDQIRALSPTPGAFTFLGDQRIKVLEAAPIAPPNQPAPTGSLFATPDGQLGVRCSEGALVLQKLIPAGRSAMTGEAYLRGLETVDGLRFTP